MYSKFVLAIRFCLAKMAILVGKWPIVISSSACMLPLIISNLPYLAIIMSTFSPLFYMQVSSSWLMEFISIEVANVII